MGVPVWVLNDGNDHVLTMLHVLTIVACSDHVACFAHTCHAPCRYTCDAVAASPEPSWGMDMGALVQPRQYAFYDSTSQVSVA